jgi:hypothetical protein
MARQLLVVIALVFAAAALVRADAFDHYINTILEKIPDADGVREVKQLTPDMILEHNSALPDSTAAFIVVQTNEGRFARLLVQAARKQLADEKKTQINILLIERFVTYRPGTERTVTVSGANVILFDGFQFSLDQGQVVPGNLSPDLRFVAREEAGKKGEIYLEPVGRAKMYLVTKAIPEATPKKSAKFVIGETFESKYFAGKFQVFDDGRRSGTLQLEVDEETGEVSGFWYSDKAGERYRVVGKVGPPKHAIQFTVKLPRTEQTFKGWMFTGTGMAITGWSKLQDREAGFYALRVEE